MTTLRKTVLATAGGLGALALVAGPGFAGGDHATPATDMVRLAHMDQWQGGYGGPMGMMGQGYNMMGPGYNMMGPPMMGQGYAMMGPGMMGPGMMGQGMMGQGMMGPAYGMATPSPCPWATTRAIDRDLSADDVRARLEQSLKWHGNTRLKVGEVTEADDDSIVADIVTLDDSLVQRLRINRHGGAMRAVQ